MEQYTNNGTSADFDIDAAMAAIRKAQRAVVSDAVQSGTVMLFNPGDFKMLTPSIEFPELEGDTGFRTRMLYDFPLILEPCGFIHTGTFDVPEKPKRRMKTVEYSAVAVVAAALLLLLLAGV